MSESYEFDVEDEIAVTEILAHSNFNDEDKIQIEKIEDIEEYDTSEVYLDENCMEIEDNDDDKSQIYHCSACEMHFPSVMDHINEYHNEKEVVIEIDENPEFITSDVLTDQKAIDNSKNHKGTKEKTSLGDSDKQCSYCLAKFSTTKALSAHMRVHKNSSSDKMKNSPVESVVEKFICGCCNTTFTTQKSLKLHGRMHKPIKQKTLEEAAEHELKACQNDLKSKKKTFFCDVCNKSYDYVFKEIHMQTHNGDTKFICTICNKKFTQESHLIMHLNAHKETRTIHTKVGKKNVPLPYACNFCGKEFARPHEKVKHERIHTGEKPHKCEICGKSFRVSYCLTLHMRTHTDARPYVCTICNKRFKAHSVYNHHLLTHSDVRAYQCPYCVKAFKTSVQLSGHKNSHTKPFSCPECNRPFATLYAVRGHMESHKRQNHNLKFECKHCGAVYARGFALKDHIKEQHLKKHDISKLNDLLDEDQIINTIGKEETVTPEQSMILTKQEVEDDQIFSEIEFATEVIVTE